MDPVDLDDKIHAATTGFIHDCLFAVFQTQFTPVQRQRCTKFAAGLQPVFRTADDNNLLRT